MFCEMGRNLMDDLNKVVNIIRTLKEIMDAMKQIMDNQFKYMNLTVPQGILIGTLAHEGKMRISDLSKKLGLSNSTVSGIIDRLEKQGIVERTRGKDDRRVVYVNMTCELKKTAKRHFDEAERKLGELINKANSEELDVILKGLDTLKKLVSEQAN
jgi:transcriptional regulator, MarR family